MTVSERMSNAGLVPVVVLENAADAVPTARALLAGGVDVMEITFRTAAAEDSIRAVAQECDEMVVGAGTVVTLEQCRRAVDAGAQFIVSPGYDDEVVAWCVEHDVTIVPGCVTPTEIMAAMKRGLSVLKFFPAGVYGGLSAMKGCGRGVNGHIAIRTNKVSMAVAELEKRGYHIIPESVKYKGDRMTLAYLEGDFGGFAVHLVQK